MRKIIDRKLLAIETDDGKLSLFKLALPLFFSAISTTLMSFVQTVVAKSYLDGFFVVPITIASTAMSFLQVVAMTVGTGTSILLSAFIGAGKREECKKLVGNSLILSVVFALVIAGFGFVLAEPLLNFMGMSKAEYAVYRVYALTIYKIRLIEIVVWLIGYTAIACLRCYGHTRIGLFASLASNVVNLVVVVLFLFAAGVQKEGAAAVFGSSPVAGCAAFTALGLICLRAKKIPLEKRLSVKLCKKIFYVGVPASISQVFYSLSQIVTTSICTNLVEAAYLAKTYITQITQFTYKFGYSVGQANSVMVGRLCGMGKTDVAFREHNQNLKIVIFCNVVLSALCAAFGNPLLKLCFGASDAVLAYSSVFFIDIAVQFGRGMNHVGEFGLNSTGDVKFTTAISVASCWAFGVGLAYIFVIVSGLGLYGMWLAFAIDELFRGCMYFIRWQKQGWKKQFYKMMKEKPSREKSAAI